MENSKNLENQIRDEIKQLILLNYKVDEIAYLLSQKYNLDINLIFEIIKQEFSLIYRFYKSLNPIMIILGFLSLIFLSFVFNTFQLSVVVLFFGFYLVVLLDYLSFSGKFNITFSYFIISLILFILLVISIATFLGKFFPISTIFAISILVLIYIVLSKKTTIFRFTNSLVEFFRFINYSLVFFAIITFSFIILSFFLSLKALIFINTIISFLVIFLFYKYSKWEFKKVFFVFFPLFLFLFNLKIIYYSNNIIKNALNNFSETNKVKIESKIFCPFYYKVNVDYSNILKSIKVVNKEPKNNTYKKILLRVVKNSCPPQIDEYVWNFNNFIEFLVFKSLQKENCYKEINKQLSNEYLQFKSDLLNLIENKELTTRDYKNLLNIFTTINLYNCYDEYYKGYKSS